MSEKHVVRVYRTKRYAVTVSVIDFQEGSYVWQDGWEHAPKHIGGVTVRSPLRSRHDDGGNYLPLQTSLAELARQVGSAQAYKSLQQDLGWAITASECVINVTVKKDDVLLASCDAECVFDFSHEYSDVGLVEFVLSNFRYDVTDTLHAAVLEARATLTKLKT